MPLSIASVILLAVIQGLAELLPVSSSAHVILVQHWLGYDPSSPQMVFLLVMLHTGTMGSVLFYFRHRWKALFQNNGAHLLKLSIYATIATGVLGLTLKAVVEHFLSATQGGAAADVEDLFRSRGAVALALTAAGTLILTSGLFQNRATPTSETQPKNLNVFSAIVIGLIQGICLPFRGFSRSGATISTALFLGIPQRLAEEFSFILAVIVTPPVIVRSLYKLHKFALIQNVELMEVLKPALLWGLSGAFVAFLAGLIGLRFLSKVLESGKWWIFGVYCYFIAAVIYFGS